MFAASVLSSSVVVISASTGASSRSLLDPVANLVAAALAGLHGLLVDLHLSPGLTWVLAVVGLVVAVRVLLLPVVVHGVRSAHAAARARPHLLEIARRYEGRRDVESLQAMQAERRAVNAEHGVSPLGCLPALAQIPVLFALYRVLVDVSEHRPVGAMTQELVSSADAAQLFGVTLADRLAPLLAADPARAGVVLALVAASVVLTYVTQRFFVLPTTTTEGMPAAMSDVQRLMPALSALGMAAAGFAVPVGVLVYWFASNCWTLLQQAVIWRFAPTPGSPAHARTACG